MGAECSRAISVSRRRSGVPDRVPLKSDARPVDRFRMTPGSPEFWILVAAGTALSAFAVCAGIAHSLDLQVRIANLRVDTRRLRRRYLRERARRLARPHAE
jgi:hypothetical protein